MRRLTGIALVLAIVLLLHTAVLADENNTQSWTTRGFDLLIQGEIEEALLALNEAIRLDPDNFRALRGISWAYYDLEQYKEALEAINSAIELNPGDETYWRQKAMVLDALHEYEEAIVAYEKAIEIEPNDGDTWSLLAVTYFHDEKFEQSLDAYNTSLTLMPFDTEIIRSRDAIVELVNQETGYVKQNTDYAVSDYYGDRVSLFTPMESVKRGESFSITINGNPDTRYYIWLHNPLEMTGLPDPKPPLISSPAAGIILDYEDGPYEIGSYQNREGRGRSIKQNVIDDNWYHGTRSYALVLLDDLGKRTVTWITSNSTIPGTYTIFVERKIADLYDSDEIRVEILE